MRRRDRFGGGGGAKGGAPFVADHEGALRKLCPGTLSICNRALGEPVPFSTKKLKKFRDIMRKIWYNRIGDPLLIRGTASHFFKKNLKIPLISQKKYVII
jgi:hypothetical protein